MIASLITAWDVYWVMQLDAIGFMFGMYGFLGLLIGGIVVAMGATDEDAGMLKVGKIMATSAALSTILCAFLPSSKSAAAMIILPALTSEEVISPVTREFKDIYTLAKIGLADLVTEDAAKTVEEENSQSQSDENRSGAEVTDEDAE